MKKIEYMVAEAIDILQRARALAESNTPTSSWCDCGPFCLRCLCIDAKGLIDDETEGPCDRNDGALLEATSLCRAYDRREMRDPVVAIAALDQIIAACTPAEA